MELAHVIVGSSKSEICRKGSRLETQKGIELHLESEGGLEAEFLLSRGTSAFSLKTLI